MPDPGEHRSWCPACDWNVVESEHPWVVWTPTRLDKLITRIRKSRAEGLYRHLVTVAPERLRPRWTPSKLLAWIIAFCVQLLPLAFLAAAVWLLAANWPEPWAFVYAAILVGIAAVLRPRFPKQPEDPLDPARYPALYALAGKAAAALGTEPPRWIVVDESFNAGLLDLGFRRGTVLSLGLPMLMVLDPQQRLALLCHEFAHGSHGDNAISGWTHRGIMGLLRLADLIIPDQVLDGFATPFNLLFYAVGRAVESVAVFLLLLTFETNQEAEFLADHRAAEVAGTEAVRGLLRGFGHGTHMARTIDRVGLIGDWRETDLMAEIAHTVRSLPPLEQERLTREARHRGTDPGSTHPPTWARIAFLEAHPCPARLEADPALDAAVDAELAALSPAVTGRLVACYGIA